MAENTVGNPPRKRAGMVEGELQTWTTRMTAVRNRALQLIRLELLWQLQLGLA